MCWSWWRLAAAGCGKPAPAAAPVPGGRAPAAVGPSAPLPAAFRPDDRTHDELVNHLAAKGLTLTIRPAGSRDTSRGVPVASLCRGPSNAHPAVLAFTAKDHRSARGTASSPGAGAFARGDSHSARRVGTT